MSDFIAELEIELRAAAHRRARRRRFAVRGAAPALRVAVALAAVVALVLVVAAAIRTSSETADDAGLPPDRGGETTLALPAAAPAVHCDAAGRPKPIATPATLESQLGVLRRAQREPDGLPALNRQSGGDDSSWLPLAAYAPDGVRWPGWERRTVEVHLVPGLGGERAGCGTPDLPPLPSVCLVVGPAGGPLDVACFTGEQVEDGAALALVAGGAVHGVAPDGVDRVVLEFAGRTASARVTENHYSVPVPGARAGESVTVRFEEASRCVSRVAPELLAAVPKLREPVPPSFRVPEGLLAGLPGRSLLDAARSVGYGEEITYWVVPQAAPSDHGPCAPPGRACVVPESGGTTVGAAVCATPREIAGRGVFLAAPLGEGTLVYGLAPKEWKRVDVERDGRTAGTVDVVGGVAAGRLRSCCDGADTIEFSQGP